MIGVSLFVFATLLLVPHRRRGAGRHAAAAAVGRDVGGERACSPLVGAPARCAHGTRERLVARRRHRRVDGHDCATASRAGARGACARPDRPTSTPPVTRILGFRVGRALDRYVLRRVHPDLRRHGARLPGARVRHRPRRQPPQVPEPQAPDARRRAELRLLAPGDDVQGAAGGGAVRDGVHRSAPSRATPRSRRRRRRGSASTASSRRSSSARRSPRSSASASASSRRGGTRSGSRSSSEHAATRRGTSARDFAYAGEGGRVYRPRSSSSTRAPCIERRGRAARARRRVPDAAHRRQRRRSGTRGRGWMLRHGHAPRAPRRHAPTSRSPSTRVLDRRMTERPRDLMLTPKAPEDMNYARARAVHHGAGALGRRRERAAGRRGCSRSRSRSPA